MSRQSSTEADETEEESQAGGLEASSAKTCSGLGALVYEMAAEPGGLRTGAVL